MMGGPPPSSAVFCPLETCGVLGFGHVATHVASSTATSVFDAFASWVVNGATWLVTTAISVITGSTRVTLNNPDFLSREEVMFKIALLVVVPMVAAATIGAVLRQDGRRLARIYAVGLPVAVLAGASVVALVQWALKVVNALCRLITVPDAYMPFRNINHSINGGGMPVVVELIVGSVLLVAALALWLELILRSVVVEIAVFFLPLGLAAIVWPVTSHIAKRFVEVVVAIIGSKFVIVATLSLAAAMVETDKAGVDDAIKATAVLLLASFAPFALLRLVPLVEIAAVAQLEGMSRRPARAIAGTAAMAVGGAKGAAGLLFSGSGPSDVGGGQVGAVDIPTRGGDFVLGRSNGPASSSGNGSGGVLPSGGSGGGGHGSSSGGGPGRGGGSWDAGRPGGGGGGGGGSGPGRPASSPAAGGAVGVSVAPAATATPAAPPGGSPSPVESALAAIPDPADLAGPLPVLPRPLPGVLTRTPGADDA